MPIVNGMTDGRRLGYRDVRGDGLDGAAGRRGAMVADLPLLDVSPAAVGLARRLVEEVRLPEQAAADALHIATAACHGVDYLLTWNAAHIANAEYRPRVERTCRAMATSRRYSARRTS